MGGEAVKGKGLVGFIIIMQPVHDLKILTLTELNFGNPDIQNDIAVRTGKKAELFEKQKQNESGTQSWT